MLRWSLMLLFLSATAGNFTSVVLEVGAKLVIKKEGDEVKLTCNLVENEFFYRFAKIIPIYWYYFNHTLGGYRIVGGDLYHIVGGDLVFQATVESSGKYLCSYTRYFHTFSPAFNVTVVERLAKLEVSATPSHLVVMEGQPVVLNCHAPTSSLAVNWSWHMTPLNRLGINVMYTGRDVVISRPEDSGYYHCMAQSLEMGINQTVNSSSFLIQVLAVPKTGLALVDHLGLAGFGLSLLGWLILLAALLFARGGYATRCTLLEEVISTSPKAKGLTGSKMATSDGLPHVESQGDYMNYTGTNLAYGDLKPNSMTGHNVYSNLS